MKHNPSKTLWTWFSTQAPCVICSKPAKVLAPEGAKVKGICSKACSMEYAELKFKLGAVK